MQVRQAGVQLMETQQPFAATSWEGDHSQLHIAVPYFQVKPAPGQIAWGRAKCGRSVKLNGTATMEPQGCDGCGT